MRREEALARMGMRLPMNKQIRLIISSDVKNEADDQYAIVHQLLPPTLKARRPAPGRPWSRAIGSF